MPEILSLWSDAQEPNLTQGGSLVTRYAGIIKIFVLLENMGGTARQWAWS